ncbi:hypothetical protein PIB30_026925 [Stylosanthes scabra]|uniref:Uncharacterized protein n=1 Tax=Stylosanthes scabra TaxID=79078 RepID=A0ABU6XCB4_9FABA|nr:hypothetical protein [Stylosanthes scabra]
MANEPTWGISEGNYIYKGVVRTSYRSSLRARNNSPTNQANSQPLERMWPINRTVRPHSQVHPPISSSRGSRRSYLGLIGEGDFWVPLVTQLQHLTYLDLSRVQIQVVPAFLGSLQHLRFLYLVGDEGPSLRIPIRSIGNLTNLCALYLKGLTFSNVSASTWLAPLSSLQYLVLFVVDLSMPQPHHNHLFKHLNLLIHQSAVQEGFRSLVT